jgi:uroporphyrinogen-III synthase
MLVTRPEPDAAETVARLAALDIEAALCPLLTHETLPTSLPDAEGFAALAITSANALRALDERGVLAHYLGLKTFTVGDRTAALAMEMGFTAVQSAGGSMSDLAELLAHSRLTGPILYPVGRDQSGDLAKSLAPFGVMVIAAQIYAMNPIAALPAQIAGELQDGSIDAVLFYSRRTAEAFVRLTADAMTREMRAQLGALCLSEAIAEPLLGAHFVRVGLADYPSEEAMMGLALSFARDQNAS